MRISSGLGLSLLALLVAGCGVGGTGSTGSTGSSSAGTVRAEQELAMKFSQCVRAHGVPDFPDPKFNNGGGVSLNAQTGTDPAKIAAATQACKQYEPNGGAPTTMDPKQLAQLRLLSRCMRANGEPNFPDPGPNGIQVDGNTSGIDPTSATFKAAQKACARYRPAGRAGDSGPAQNQSN